MSTSGAKEGPSRGGSRYGGSQGGGSPGRIRALPTLNEGQRPSSRGSAVGGLASPNPSQQRPPSSRGGNQGFPTPLGHDPGRFESLPELSHADVIGKRIDLPPEAFFTDEKDQSTSKKGVARVAIQRRPAYSTAGKVGKVQVNQYSLTSIQVTKICQYDVCYSLCFLIVET
jgi:hypothetical protein